MDLFVAETAGIRLRADFLARASALRSQLSHLRNQVQRDGFVLEQLSLRTKTPYVQFTLTRRLNAAAQDDDSAAAAGPASEGASEETATTGGVTSALAAPSKDPRSRPPM